jgi:hypothetical protein
MGGERTGWFGRIVRHQGSSPEPTQREHTPEAEHESRLVANRLIRAELRVHGVSATPPATMLASPSLQSPSPVRVAGDKLSGFYRREYQDNRRWDRVEAYSWGGLTSGGGLRALWLLLTPFLLANVAFWTSPVPLGQHRDETLPGDAGRRWLVRWASGVVQRLFALSLTATFVLGFVAAAMDIIGWQYARTFVEVSHHVFSGAQQVGWLSFLGWSWLNHPNLQYLATSLVPLAAVLVIWGLGYWTWRRLESVNGKGVPAAQLRTPLEDRRMWNGIGPVARLRAVHVSFGLALVGLSILCPLLLTASPLRLRAGISDSPWSIVAAVLGGLFAVQIAIMTILVCRRVMSYRPRLSETDVPAPSAPWGYRILPRLTLVLVVVAGAAVVASGDSFPTPANGSLPVLVVTIAVLFAVQAALLLCLGLFTLILRSAIPIDPATEVPHVECGTAMNGRPVWFGLTPVVLSTLGWLLAGSWAAALTIFAAMTTGRTVISSAVMGADSASAIFVPAPLIWAAGGTFAAGLVGCLILIGVGVYAWVAKDRLSENVKAAYAGEARGPLDSPANLRRFRYIRRNFLVGRAPDFVAGTVGLFTGLLWVIVVVGIVWYALDGTWISSLPFLYQVGSVEIVAIGSLSLLMARLAFSDPEDRKKIGILWDVGTFWPRATHPLAPPCYSERAVPDLIERVEYYRGEYGTDEDVPLGGAPVVLSCHSQGSIIGAAAILQLRFRHSANVRFLTYGSPLRRLYACYFPSYFGAKTLCRVGALVSTVDGWIAPITGTDAARKSWRWRNLWRPTDPVGHPIFVNYDSYRKTDDIDQKLRDPVRFRNPPSDPCDPQANDHSNYPMESGYADALDALLGFPPAPGAS